MARSRVPKPGAVVATIARLLGLSASVAVLAVLVYESVNWDAKGKTYGVAISAAIVAILVDVSEIAGLIDSTRTIPRAPSGLMACEDVVVICLAIPSVITILLSDYRREDRPEERPWRNADALATWLMIGIW
ncbi:hypothetical protein UCREL1_3398 [Eutypa lata UCREL1]|uniref:Integral membrane protein n=1 Tax=Eutypa lata (strain UCR-EL1) TaxID=1287681 RepID=M7THZ9_EUTLA|nr:hypothetical protein UCREL1_3398 [Eutypa lata UCREL1]